MLTDYHTHLRPDVRDTPPARYFTEENVSRYLEAARARGVEELGFSEHVYRFRESLDIWQHPFWRECALDSLDEYVDFLTRMPVKVGLEVDWIAGREEQIARLIEAYDWDYIIGSVHFIADRGAVDHDGYDIWDSSSPDEVWTAYFEALGEAAASGLYDVLAHPDLVKVWGKGRPDPARPKREYYELAMDRIAAADVAIEISTAGLRKPVGELYPDRELLEMCVAAGKPVSLSSDAHEPETIGYAYDQALELMRDCGIGSISVFESRNRREIPLG